MKKKLVLSFLIIIIIAIGSGVILLLIFQEFSIKDNVNENYEYDIQIAFQNLTFTRPVGIYSPGGGTDRLFVVEQDGRILVFDNNQNSTDYEIFLDIKSQIAAGGEKGLLGLAFHPNFTLNNYFYVYYVDLVNEDSVLSRFKVDSTDINKANKTSETILLTIPQPYSNHNGGQISFGPDGYLYIALGDGGGSGDPDGNGQNRQSLLGSILRIDIDSSFPYSIPNDNPFYGNTNGWAEEIFAFGFRNPWRFSFDPITGMLWTGDVGQSLWEEIDIVENGKNYGWNSKEGFHDFNPGTNVTIIENPIYEYNHSLGRSITGGFVYRGSVLSGLIGKYIYADFISGRIWALEYSGGAVLNNTELIDTDLNISSFGIDANNELFICAFDGRIYTLIQKS